MKSDTSEGSKTPSTGASRGSATRSPTDAGYMFDGDGGSVGATSFGSAPAAMDLCVCVGGELKDVAKIRALIDYCGERVVDALLDRFEQRQRVLLLAEISPREAVANLRLVKRVRIGVGLDSMPTLDLYGDDGSVKSLADLEAMVRHYGTSLAENVLRHAERKAGWFKKTIGWRSEHGASVGRGVEPMNELREKLGIERRSN